MTGVCLEICKTRDSPGQSFGSGTFFNKRSPLKKRFLSDILHLPIFSPKETVTLWNYNMSKTIVNKSLHFEMLWPMLAVGAVSLHYRGRTRRGLFSFKVSLQFIILEFSQLIKNTTTVGRRFSSFNRRGACKFKTIILLLLAPNQATTIVNIPLL